MSINLIAAVDKNLGLGKGGKLLLSIPEDMKLFKALTENNVVIMGRKTFDSLPSRKPLKNRINIVLSNNRNFHPEGVCTFSDKEKALEYAKSLKKDIFIIGGGEIYRQFAHDAEVAFITYIDRDFGADVHFPDIFKEHEWKLVSEEGPFDYEGIEYFFRNYKKISEKHS